LKENQVVGDIENLNNLLWTQIQAEIDSSDSNHHIIRKYESLDDVQVFIESIKPTIRILLFGAGNDTIPLVKMANILGLEVFLIDGRKNLATTVRFPTVVKIITGSGDEVVKDLDADYNTAALLMTHN